MKVTYNTGKMSVELEGETQRDLFGQLAAFQEVFDETTCGKCGSTNVEFAVRRHEDNEYYEIRCKDCRAKLAFGCMKKGGGLFPKRKDADGNWLPDNGWVKWDREAGKEV
jgi:DNA-directed RNA polymerase subunit RPC12/RpoP